MQDTSNVQDFQDAFNIDPAPSMDPIGMKDTSRALRRHHLARIKAVRTKHMLVARDDGKQPSARLVGFHANTAAVCSCSMCGNPRKFFGARTRQEQRIMQRIRPWATNK